MSIPADTLKYSEIHDAMEALESPESVLIAGFLEANKEHINDPASSPPGKAAWEGYDSPSMTPGELWEATREELEEDEFENALGYLTEHPVSPAGTRYHQGRIFEAEDEEIVFPRHRVIDGLGSLLIEGSREGNRKAIEVVRRHEDEEGGLTPDQIDERVEDHYSFARLTEPLGFVNETVLETETDPVHVYTSNLGNKFEAELYRELGRFGKIDIEIGSPGSYSLEVDDSFSRSYLRSARDGLRRLGLND
jgi:hypothetical protein